MRNPFSLTFGVQPEHLISRPVQKNEIIEMFSREYPSNRAYMITGVRGSGKTVLLTEICRYFQKEDHCIVVELNPETDMLESLASKIFHSELCHQWLLTAKFNVSILGVGFSIENTPITSNEVLIERMLKVLKLHHIRTIIAVDEASDTVFVRQFAHTFQMMIRQDYDLCLIMTGLYDNLYDLQNIKTLTFLYRAPKIFMGPLNYEMIEESYTTVFNQDKNTSVAMARMSGGYPFAYQVLGYLRWEDRGSDLKKIQSMMDSYLAEYVYDKIWHSLSQKERGIVIFLAKKSEERHNPDGSADIKSLREMAGLKSNEMSVYRERLLRKGIVESRSYGKLSLVLPGFDRYALNKELYEY